jgi:hypothetical protein
MKKQFILAILVAGTALGGQALAQSKGEADPAQSRAAPSAKATPEEKKSAAAARKQAGAVEAKTHPTGDDQPSTTAKAPRAPKDERQAAAAKRKAEVVDASKKGELKTGEK